MLLIKTYTYLGKAVVSVHCMDIALGHDHCLWTGEKLLLAGDPLDVLETTAYALLYVADRERRDELDSCTEDCLGLR
jgi:hypothetical protein